MIPDASSSLLGKCRPCLRDQMECHLSLKVEVLAYARQLCVQDGGTLSHINPRRTRRKFENYDGSRRHEHVRRMGPECINARPVISQGKMYEKCERYEKKVEI